VSKSARMRRITLPMPDAAGVSTFGDNVYEGEWQEDQMHGHGTHSLWSCSAFPRDRCCLLAAF
jgi:hypothetical protein